MSSLCVCHEKPQAISNHNHGFCDTIITLSIYYMCLLINLAVNGNRTCALFVLCQDKYHFLGISHEYLNILYDQNFMEHCTALLILVFVLYKAHTYMLGRNKRNSKINAKQVILWFWGHIIQSDIIDIHIWHKRDQLQILQVLYC